MRIFPLSRRYLAVFFIATWLVALPGFADPPAPNGWWHTSDLVDYGIIAGSLGIFAGTHFATPLDSAGIGPRFDPQHPASILDPVYSDRIGKKYRVEDKQETVPALWVEVALANWPSSAPNTKVLLITW